MRDGIHSDEATINGADIERVGGGGSTRATMSGSSTSRRWSEALVLVHVTNSTSKPSSKIIISRAAAASSVDIGLGEVH